MCFLQKAVPLMVVFFFLWPQVVRCLTLPENIPRGNLAQGRLLRNVINRPALARVPEILEYSPEASVLKFKISCDDCVDEDKKRLEEEIISIEVTSTDVQSCSHTDDVGLRINGQDLRPNTGSTENTQSFFGPLTRSIEVGKSVLDRIRWTNICGCPNALPGEDCGDDFESVLIFEVPGMRGSTPGFTLSYKPYSGRRLLRVSNFPDTTLMSFPIFGRSLHWRSPLLQLQMGLMPTSTLLSSFSSAFPSLTSSAASAVYTASSGHVSSETQPPAPATTPPLAIPTPAASPTHADALPTALGPVLNVQGPGTWRSPVHISESISALEQGLTTVWNKAHGAAQFAVTGLQHWHCSKNEAPKSIKGQSGPAALFSATPSNTARAKIPTVSSLVQQSKALITDSNARDPHVTSKRAVIAFQLTALVTIIFVLCTAIFILIRRNPRLRAEMAARREERRNRRLFRRAACHYRWRKMLERFKAISGQYSNDTRGIEDGTATSSTRLDGALDSVDSDEKRTSTEVLAVTNTAGIRDGLRELRKAHRLVDGMVSAEEGRYAVAGRTTRHHRSWSDSASSEKTAPPPYEEEEVMVADGMRYVRYIRDTTPDSSVMATSPYSSVIDSDSESEKE